MNTTVKKIVLEGILASNKEALINRLASILEDREIDAAAYDGTDASIRGKQ